MYEFIKVLCVVVIMFGSVVAAVAWWGLDPRTENVTPIRVISTVVTILGFLGFFVLLFRRDRVPDFLREFSAAYFERSGLCFSIEPAISRNYLYLCILFQNRFDRPCNAKLAIRPSELLGTIARGDYPAAQVEITCPAAGFGMSILLLPVPQEIQGKRQSFHVGATVIYPEGTGRQLRFGSRGAITIRTNADFQSPFNQSLTIAAALGGSIFISRPALLKLELPYNVSETVPFHYTPSSEIFWRLGDDFELPPLAVAKIAVAIGGPEQ